MNVPCRRKGDGSRTDMLYGIKIANSLTRDIDRRRDGDSTAAKSAHDNRSTGHNDGRFDADASRFQVKRWRNARRHRDAPWKGGDAKRSCGLDRCYRSRCPCDGGRTDPDITRRENASSAASHDTRGDIHC